MKAQIVILKDSEVKVKRGNHVRYREVAMEIELPDELGILLSKEQGEVQINYKLNDLTYSSTLKLHKEDKEQWLIKEGLIRCILENEQSKNSLQFHIDELKKSQQ